MKKSYNEEISGTILWASFKAEWKISIFLQPSKIKVSNIFSAFSTKGKECKNNKVPYVWIKQRERLDQIFWGPFQTGLFYNFIQNKWASKKWKTLWWGKFCLGTWWEKSAFCCILAHRHYKYNLCGWVQLWRVENLLRFCCWLFFHQSITGESQRKFGFQKTSQSPQNYQRTPGHTGAVYKTC